MRGVSKEVCPQGSMAPFKKGKNHYIDPYDGGNPRRNRERCGRGDQSHNELESTIRKSRPCTLGSTTLGPTATPRGLSQPRRLSRRSGHEREAYLQKEIVERQFAGIDVRRDSLRLAAHPGGQNGDLPNTLERRAAFITRLQKEQVALLAVEACGGLECT